MQANSTRASRIAEAIGSDNAYDVARKFAAIGIELTPQSVYGWLSGAEISEKNLAGLVQIYGYSPAWIRYAVGPKKVDDPDNGQSRDLFLDLPPETAQRTLDFLGYQLHREADLIASDKLGRYMNYIDRIQQAIAARRKPDDGKQDGG